MLKLAMFSRLWAAESDVKILKCEFLGQSDILSFTLSGDQVPDCLRTDRLLVVGSKSFKMAFLGEPIPCNVCDGVDHTSRVCPVLKSRREKEGCHNCGKQGHFKAICPDRVTPTCYTCKEPGHFMRYCKQTVCFKCGRKGHRASDCKFKSVARPTTKKSAPTTSEKEEPPTSKEVAVTKSSESPPSKVVEGREETKEEGECAPSTTSEKEEPLTSTKEVVATKSSESPPSKVVEGQEETKEEGESLKETQVVVDDEDNWYVDADYERNYPAIEAAENRVLTRSRAKRKTGSKKK